LTTGTAALALVLSLACVPSAHAASFPVTLQYKIFSTTTSAQIQSTSEINSFNAWFNGGPVQELGLQQYYYRIGNGSIVPFSNLIWTASQTQTNAATLTASVGSQFNISSTYTVAHNQITAAVTLTGLSGATGADLSIFQLRTLDLNNAALPQTTLAELDQANQLTVTDQTTTNMTDTTTANVPTGPGYALQQPTAPTAFQVGQDTSLFANLDLTGTPTNNADLNNTNYYQGINSEYAFEWTFPLTASGAGNQAVLTFTQQFSTYTAPPAPFAPAGPVPEPGVAVLSLLSLGTLAGVAASRRARREA
jgi:hypothetical protein